MSLIVSFFATKAQDITTVKKSIPKGSKIFIDTPNKVECKKAKDMLTKWAYWEIVDEKKDADFTMDISVERVDAIVLGKRFITIADFLDKNGKSIFKTEGVKVLNRDLAINALLDKRIEK